MDDCSCKVENLDSLNNRKVYPVLKSLLQRDYFRYFKVIYKFFSLWMGEGKRGHFCCYYAIKGLVNRNMLGRYFCVSLQYSYWYLSRIMRHIVVCNNYFYSVWLNYSIKYILYFDELEYKWHTWLL